MASYLTSDEAAAYGAGGVTAAQIVQASRLVDTYLRRPEGLVWAPDRLGRPAYMDALSATYSMTASAGVAPGSNVVVPIGNMVHGTALVGEAVVLDRAGGQSVTETCIVTAATDASVTLDVVGCAHSSGCSLETGLVIVEERKMPAKRSVTSVARPNLARLLGVMGRYGYGRRSDQMSGTYNEVNLLATLSTFGGPPPWIPIDVGTTQISAATGEVWVPAGIMLAYYTDVVFRYLAGWPVSGLPVAIKQATAMLASAIADDDMPASFASLKAGDTQVTRFGASSSRGGARRVGGGISAITTDVAALLDPYRIRALF